MLSRHTADERIYAPSTAYPVPHSVRGKEVQDSEDIGDQHGNTIGRGNLEARASA